MSTRHTEDCIYSGQTETCDGSCTQQETWRRRRWPWPRLEPSIPVGDSALPTGVDPAVVDALLNGSRDRDSAREVRQR